MNTPSTHWPPRQYDHVTIRDTGDLAVVMEIMPIVDSLDDLRFVVHAYPDVLDTEPSAANPMELRVYRLDQLHPEFVPLRR
jgi:hypothetical protein